MGVTQSSPHGVMNSAVSFPLWVDNMYLGADSAESYTIPAGAGFAVITANQPFWARVGGTASIPTTEVADGTGSFYVAAGMQCKLSSGKTLSVIRVPSTTTIISIGVYRA